ncbi:MAG: indole-3-glycerol phosphate synthase TrpC [Opitutaceae bacterium]
MSDKLSEIMAWKRREVAALAASVPATEADLSRLDAALPRPPSFAGALRRSDGRLAVIGEIKRRSPSAGEIRSAASAATEAARYRAADVDALSVLTDARYFGGDLADLRDAVERLRAEPPARPCLRKDFFVHPVQVRQAREAGASAVLLIVRDLPDEEIRVLFGAAQAAGLDALFEVHDAAELERAVRHGATVIGVNNRDLAVFRTDLTIGERLIPQIPKDRVAVAESGIFTGSDAGRMRKAGANAVLVGEALMKAAAPRTLVAEFRSA